MKARPGCLSLLVRGVILLMLFLAWGWGALALFFSGPEPEWLKMVVACLFVLSLPGAFGISRSFMRGVFLCFGVFAVLVIWWQQLQPTNFKDWAPDVARISHGKIIGDRLVMYNVRNFQYTSENDFHQRWETREYDLNNLQGLDLFLSYWASDHIAHTILSWDFGNENHLAISIETRKDKTQKYSAVKGFFKQFELSYIAADEKDIIKLRTNYRKERVYVYRLLAPQKRARAILESYLAEMNRLVDEPQFYNALTRNCTTTIQLHANATNPEKPPPIDWRILASGHVDELLYDRGVIMQELTFAELRRASRIDQQMQKYKGERYSKMLRKSIPQPDTVDLANRNGKGGTK